MSNTKTPNITPNITSNISGRLRHLISHKDIVSIETYLNHIKTAYTPEQVDTFVTECGGDLLWEAVYKGDIDIVNVFLKINADVNYVRIMERPFVLHKHYTYIDTLDRVPILGVAIRQGNFEIIQALFDCPALNPNILMSYVNYDARFFGHGGYPPVRYQSNTLLYSILNDNYAVSFGKIAPICMNRVIELLLNHPKIDVNTLDDQGVLLLNVALKKSNTTRISDDILCKIIELTEPRNILSIDPFVIGAFGRTSIYFVHQMMVSLDVIRMMRFTKLLLDKVDSQDIKNYITRTESMMRTTLLHEAIKYGGLEQFDLIMDKMGPDCLLLQDGWGSVPLYTALISWNCSHTYGLKQQVALNIIMALLEYPDISSSFNICDYLGTPLQYETRRNITSHPNFSAELHTKFMTIANQTQVLS